MEYERLNQALETLMNESTSESTSGGIILDDLIPIETKIKNLRVILKELNARILYLKSASKESRSSEVSEDDLSSTFDKLTEDIMSQCIINDKGINIALETLAIEEIFNDPKESELQEKLKIIFGVIYQKNDKALTIQNEIKNMKIKLHDLKNRDKIEAQNYREFLKGQEELRVEKLQQSNPLIAQYKQKIERSIYRINIMKKLIIKFVSGCNLLTSEEPFLLEMLKSHRNFLTLESLSNMVENKESNSEE